MSKLPNFKQELKERQRVADKFTERLSKIFQTPIIRPNRTSAWAQYTLRVTNRDNLQLKLKAEGIPTSVFYPIPLNLQECFNYLGSTRGDFPVSDKASKEVLSIPMNSFINNSQLDYIVNKILKNI